MRWLSIDPSGREWPRLEVLGSFLSLLPFLPTELVVLLGGILSFDTLRYTGVGKSRFTVVIQINNTIINK